MIAGTDRGTNLIIQNAKTSQYAWNSVLIDNTYISRSLATIGRELRFPLDVEISPAPQLNNTNNGALFQYLRNMTADLVFALYVLQILIEEHRTSHHNIHNKGKPVCNLKVGDVVKAHVQVNYVTDKGLVSKLIYKAKDPFTITADLGHHIFEVQPYDETNYAKRKYKNTEVYPPFFISSETAGYNWPTVPQQ